MRKPYLSNETLGVLMVFAGGCLWGFSGACGQFLFQNKEMVSSWLVPVRLLSAGIILLALLGATRGKAVFDVWKDKKDAVHIVLYGLLGMSGCQFAYFTAVQYSNAGTATVLQYIGPALILLWLCLRQHRLPSAREAVGLCLALAGTFLIATHGDPTSLALSPQGLFWGLCAAVFVAVYTLQPAHLLSKHDSATVVGWGMLIGGLMQMIVLRPWTISVKVDGEVIWYMALIVIVGTILTFTMYLDGIKRIGPARGSMISAVEPVSAALFAVCWLGTPITKVDLIGFACILAMILLLSKPQKVKD